MRLRLRRNVMLATAQITGSKAALVEAITGAAGPDALSVPRAANRAAPLATVASVDEDGVGAMKVAELKARRQSLGVKASGTTPELQARLRGLAENEAKATQRVHGDSLQPPTTDQLKDTRAVISYSMFPTLQGEATSGKAKVWSIRVFERQDGAGVIETSHGYLGGKIQTKEKAITQGKNIGRKNETTPIQQAESEARSAWKKKKENGYAEQGKEVMETDPSTRGKGDDASADVPWPMLAHEYQKRGKGFVFPCYVQPKLDGTRAVGMPGKGIFSRLRKTFPHMEHILGELAQLPKDLILDGELYTNELTFQELVGLVKREKLKAGDAEKQLKIKYHVYDLIVNHPYETRKGMLAALFESHLFHHLVMVPTDRCESDAQMKLQHNAYVEDGFEGIMLRAPYGDYKHSRSTDLLKYKKFLDTEFEVVGFKEGEGQDKGCVIWMCRTEGGGTFHCRPRGTRESRMELFRNGGDYVGKMLTVRYQELTCSEEQVPRFPVGIAFRDD
jgi:hypothetical protein